MSKTIALPILSILLFGMLSCGRHAAAPVPSDGTYRDTVVVTVYKDSVIFTEASPGFIVVDKGAMNVTLYTADGKIKHQYGIACGAAYGNKGAENDMKTPEGLFHVAQIGNSTDWPYTDPFTGKTSMGCFGPKFIRLKEEPHIGIHGTNAPRSIGKRCSHGCIRVTSENIVKLAADVYPGMPVIIIASGKDAVADYNLKR